MQRTESLHCNRQRRGISLIEPTVVALIAVLAAIGGPHLLERSERQKADEAFKYLKAVQTAQEQFHANHHRYASNLEQLDLDRLSPAYFDVGVIRLSSDSMDSNSSPKNAWSLVLTRCGGVINGSYGNYTVSFTNLGFDALRSSIDPVLQARNPN